MIARVVIEMLQMKFLLSTVTVQDLLPEDAFYHILSVHLYHLCPTG